MENHTILNILVILLATLTLTVMLANGDQEQLACKQQDDVGNGWEEEEPENCTEIKETRYYFDSNAKTCKSIRTCNITLLESLHRSIEECRSRCNVIVPCPALNSGSYNSVILSTCLQASTYCKAIYRCNNGYYFFTGNIRTCKNGVWSPEPICAKPFIYHKGKQLKKHSTVYIEEDSQELVECRVLPQLPKNTKISWTNQKREVINGTWNETGYQLTVSSKDTFPAEYYCNVKVTIDGNEKSFQTSVRFEVNISNATLEILYSVAYYDHSLPGVKGECLCQGSPKPRVTWYINNIKHDGDAIDVTNTSDEITLSVLKITTNPQSGKYKCSCSNGEETVEWPEFLVHAPSIGHTTTTTTTTRRKRSRKSGEAHTTICDIIKTSTLTMTGTVKRRLSSSSLIHVKRINALYSRKSDNGPEMMRITTNEEVKRNKTYLMILQETKEGSYSLTLKLPYSVELVNQLNKLCKL